MPEDEEDDGGDGFDGDADEDGDFEPPVINKRPVSPSLPQREKKEKRGYPLYDSWCKQEEVLQSGVAQQAQQQQVLEQLTPTPNTNHTLTLTLTLTITLTLTLTLRCSSSRSLRSL